MTDIFCNVKKCIYNKENTCTKENIEIRMTSDCEDNEYTICSDYTY